MSFSLPTPTPGARVQVPFADLYPDMQVILDDCLQAGGCLWKAMPPSLEAVAIPLSCLPTAKLEDEDTSEFLSADQAKESGYDRGRAYAQAMVMSKTPPIIIADGNWWDGRHRAYQARRLGATHIWAFDLSGLGCHPVGGLGQLVHDPQGEPTASSLPGLDAAACKAWLVDLRDKKVEAEALLDVVTDPEVLNKALQVCAIHNSMDMIRRLLKRVEVDPKLQRSKALNEAARMDRMDIARLLYPVSDPSQVVDDLSSDGHWDGIKSLLLLSVEHHDGLAAAWVAVLGERLPEVKCALERVQLAEARAARAADVHPTQAPRSRLRP